MGELQIPTKIVDLGLLLLRLLGFAVSMLLTFCHRNPVRNDARGCALSIAATRGCFRSASSRATSAEKSVMSLTRLGTSAAGVCAKMVRR